MGTYSPFDPAPQGTPFLVVVLAPQLLVGWGVTQTGAGSGAGLVSASGGAGAGLAAWPSDPCGVR